jgi:hypothetical protein
MNRALLAFLAFSVALTGFSSPAQAQQQAGPSKEFLLSCSYGVLAGTLVGTASLAFEEHPGDKLHRVARGASLGLYGGILLGLYVVYVVPKQIEREKQRRLRDSFAMGLAPSFDPQSSKVDGAALQLAVFNF